LLFTSPACVEVTSCTKDEDSHSDKEGVKHAAEETSMDAGETISKGALFFFIVNCYCLQCFDAVGLAPGRASGL